MQVVLLDSNSYFKMNNHPDEKERLELGKRLSLEGKQVKFWFQNRRTQMKVISIFLPGLSLVILFIFDVE